MTTAELAKRTIKLTPDGEVAHESIMNHLLSHSPLIQLGSDQMNVLRDMLLDICDPDTRPKPYTREL